MTSASSSPPGDVPFTVRDRRRKGFFTIDNELLDRYGAQLKAHGLAVYMALARFANQEGACWPSLATIAKRTGMSRMQVIRELANLQDRGLIAIEHQYGEKGEHKANIYTLLNLPEVVTDSDHPNNTLLHGVVTDSDHPSHREKPKQYPENKIHPNHTQRTKHARRDQENTTTNGERQTIGGGAVSIAESFLDDNKTTKTSPSVLTSVPISLPLPAAPALVVECQQNGAILLIATGMTAKVAQRLAEHYSLARIEEKVGYLHFIQTHQPENVKNPCGWLRKAIEDDFAAPDGYLSPAAQDAQLAAKLAFADQLLEPLESHTAAPRPEPPVPPQASDETMQADHILWQQTLVDLKTMGRAYLCALLTDTHIIQCADETVIVGVPHAFHCTQLQHPQTKLAIGRTLTEVAGRPLVPEFVLVSEGESSVDRSPGEGTI